MELIVENKFGSAYYDPGTKIIYSRYYGIVNVELALEILEAQKKFGLENGAKAICADLSELKGTFTMVNEYLTTEFFPPLIQQGLICNAIAVSPDIFSQFATKDLIKKMGSFELQTFGDLDEAKSWVVMRVS